MKKHLLTFALLSVLVLAGCSDNTSTSSDETSSNEPVSSVVDEPSTSSEDSSVIDEEDSSISEEEEPSTSEEEDPISSSEDPISSSEEEGNTSSSEEETPSEETHDYVVDFASISSTASFGEEDKSSEWTMGDFYIWNDQGWCGGNVTVSENGYNSETGGYDFAWSTEDVDVGWATVAPWYAMQVFMKLPSGYIDVGSNLLVTATITASEEMKVTICGNEITLAAGTNELSDLVSSTSMYEATANNAEFSMQMGWTSDSSHTYTGDISIDYLAFDSYVIPDTPASDDDSHDYVLDLANTPDAAFGEEGSCSTWTGGNFYYWNDQWWVGGNVTVGSAGYSADTSSYNFAWSSEGSPCWYSFQIFMKFATGYIDVGSQFTITATITAEAETKITLNGNEITLNAGENQISDLLSSRNVAESSVNSADISIQAGWESGAVADSGNIQISYLAFDAYTAA